MKKKNIAVLYDERSTHTSTVKEHLCSFKDFSRHNIFYAPATNIHWPYGAGYTDEFSGEIAPSGKWDLSAFDALVVHYSVRMSLKKYVAPHIAEAIRKFKGKKILFIQDEYEHVDTARANIDDLGFDTVFTCVPPEGLEYVYEAFSKRSHIEFRQTLTGFVPYLNDLTPFTRPMEDREIVVAYRGRRLPHHYGMLGYDKYIIGERFREEAAKRSIKSDVESDDAKRIYGSWYEFLGSSRATLGTESGCNIFDFDGALKTKADELAEHPFMQVYADAFSAHEGVVTMNQISPKFFEAIILRTALVCFPGSYSGILLNNEHFIQIERDFSNIDEVIAKLEDVEFLKDLTDRTYRDIIEPGIYSYKTFVRNFDDWLDSKIQTSRTEIVSSPIGTMKESKFTAFGPQSASDLLLNTSILTDLEREAFCLEFQHAPSTEITWNCAQERFGARIAKSSAFFEAPHDAGSLLRPVVVSNYAAELDGVNTEHFLEIDLGWVRSVCGITLEWLSEENFAEAFTIKGRNRMRWKTLCAEALNKEVQIDLRFDVMNLRTIRLDVSKFKGQQRILIKKLQVLSR